jgi:hypothetical protein
MTILEIFNEVREWALSAVKSASPIKTGKLRDSFELIEYEDGWGIRTTIDYMVYTEMKWTYNSRWDKTLQNPNEAWFRNVAIVISEELARRIGGVVYVIS